MARIRTIKPEFFTNLTIAELTYRARLTYIGLWCHCDDAGRCLDEARLIKGAVWPLEDTIGASEIEADLKELAMHDLIVRYVVEGRSYLEVCRWKRHQKINRSSRPIHPAPGSLMDDSVNAHGLLTEDSLSTHDGNREQGTGKGTGKGNTSVVRDSADDTPEADRLCLLLADLIEAHAGNRPRVSAAWHRDMDLLIRRGPLGIDKPDRWDASRIESGMRRVFSELAEKRNDFCWADQVQSPNALRRHWPKIGQVFRNNGKRGWTDPFGREVQQ